MIEITCPDCHGSGAWQDPDNGKWLPCLDCHGTGIVIEDPEAEPEPASVIV